MRPTVEVPHDSTCRVGAGASCRLQAKVLQAVRLQAVRLQAAGCRLQAAG